MKRIKIKITTLFILIEYFTRNVHLNITPFICIYNPTSIFGV